MLVLVPAGAQAQECGWYGPDNLLHLKDYYCYDPSSGWQLLYSGPADYRAYRDCSYDCYDGDGGYYNEFGWYPHLGPPYSGYGI